MSNQFDRHPFDHPLTHAAQLKVGGLETPEIEEGPGTMKAFKAIMDALPAGPSEWATKAETRIMQLAAMPGIENFGVAVEVQHAIDQACASKEAAIKTLCADWADDDTTVKKMAAPYIGDFDAARPADEHGLGFRGVVEVTEALISKLAERDVTIEARERTLSDLRNELASAQYVIGKREVEIEKLKKDVNDLNRLLRSVGWGQGEIDSSATLAEESEAKDAEIAKLKTDLQDADRINNELCGVIVRNAQHTAELDGTLETAVKGSFDASAVMAKENARLREEIRKHQNAWEHSASGSPDLLAKLGEHNAALCALLERVPHREWSEYEKHSINGDDAIQFSSDCPKCAYEKLYEKETKS